MNEAKVDIYLGSEFKAFIKLDSVGSLTMDDYDFYAEYYCSPNKRIKVEKGEMIRKGENEYWACLNSEDLGTGTLKCNVIRYIPDADFQDGLRTDRKLFDFDIRVIR